MNILQVAERTLPAKGGVELYTARISEELAKLGHNVTLVVFNSIDPRDCGFGITYQKPLLVSTPKKCTLLEEEYVNGVRILRFESKLQFFSFYWSPKMLSWLLANSVNFDIINTHTYRFSNNEFTAFAQLRNKIPFVYTGHDKLKLDYMNFPLRAWDNLYRFSIGRAIFNQASRLIGANKEYMNDYIQLFNIPPNKIKVVPLGLDYDKFASLPPAKDLRELLGNPQKIVLYIGRFIDYKRPDMVVQAFKKVLDKYNDTFLIMLGKDYGLMSECKRLVSEYHLEKRVIFFEDAPESLKFQALSIADVCVVPSDYESFGIVALEAQAAGVPVVANNCGGLKDLVKNGETGLVLEKRTSDEIAEKVLTILQNDNLRASMKSNSKAFAKGFSWRSVASQLSDIYTEVLDEEG